jgi:DnaJ-class molecular chaperone
LNYFAKVGLGAVGVLSLIVLIKGKKKNKEFVEDPSDYWEKDKYSDDYKGQDYEQKSDNTHQNQSEYTLKECYEILELDENATSDQIKAARNRLALQWHPDKHRSARRKAIAEIETKKIITAYERLRNAGKVS